MSKVKEYAPKTWRDHLANGIEEVRAQTVATIESGLTGQEVEANYLEYIDLHELGKEPEQETLGEYVERINRPSLAELIEKGKAIRAEQEQGKEQALEQER